jgi:MFS family permease
VRGSGYAEVVRDRRFRLVFALNLVFVGIGVGQIENAFPAFATEVGGASPRILGIAFAADTLVIVLCQFWVTARMRGRRRTRGLMLESVFWAAAWALALSAASLGAPYLFVAVAVLFACAEMLHSPTIPAIVNDLAPDHLRGRYNAAGALSWQTARVLGATTRRAAARPRPRRPAARRPDRAERLRSAPRAAARTGLTGGSKRNTPSAWKPRSDNLTA